MPTFTGTPDNDVYGETGNSDTYDLLGGNDTVTVSVGTDTVNGGIGTDTLIANYSAATGDIVSDGPRAGTSGEGFDGAYYQSIGGNPAVTYSSIERFDITTGGGNDNIRTASGDDIVRTGAGNDFVNFGSGSDSGDGGTDNDGFSADLSTYGSGVSFDLTSTGAQGGPGTIVNFEYLGILTTTGLADVVITGAINENETVNLGGGDDRVTVAGGMDAVNGGIGTDTLVANYSAATGNIISDGPRASTSGEGFDGGYYQSVGSNPGVTFTSFERFHITTGIGADHIITASGDDIVRTGAGNDFVNFGSGSDSGDGGTDEDGFSADLSAYGSGVSFDLTSTGAQGGPGTIVNFEYLGVLTTTGLADVVKTGAINRAETVNLGAGDDTVTVAGGLDVVNGGIGTDTLIANYSAATGDIISDGPRASTSGEGFDGAYYQSVGSIPGVTYTSFERFDITTGIGNDNITTASGDDIVRTGIGNDIVNAAAGTDLVEGGDGNDTLNGGDGTDTLSYASASAGVTVSLAATAAQDTVGAGTDTLSNFENILGSAHGDTLAGNGGNNLIDGGLGGDAMSGGAGDDIYIVDSLTDAVTENAGDVEGMADEVRTSLSSYTLPDNVEILTYTGSGSATLRGNAADNRLTGGNGSTLFQLQDGGNDTATGGADGDIFFFGGAFTADDTVVGGGGFDTIVLQGDYSGGVTLDGSTAGVEGISLQSGSVTRWTGSMPTSYDYRLSTSEAAVAPGAQLRINGQSLIAGEDLTFDGSAETDGGTFLVYGGYGRDDLTGGAGNDIFYFEAGRFGNTDTVDGGGGRDAVVISGYGPDPVNPLQITFASGSLANVEALSFNGRFGSDPSAAPSYEVALEKGNVKAGETLIVNASSLGYGQLLDFDGSAVENGRFEIYGGYGADRLTGGGSGDTLMGAVGADELIGGGGGDVFRYDRVADSYAGSRDSILQFETGSDKIDLSRIDANVHVEGDQAFRFVTGFTGAGQASAGELRIRSDLATPNQWFVEGDINGDGTADLSIAFHETPLIVASDILL